MSTKVPWNYSTTAVDLTTNKHLVRGLKCPGGCYSEAEW